MIQLQVVDEWLGQLAPATRKGYKSHILDFERFCKRQGAFQSLGEMVAFQEGAAGRDRFKIVDLAVAWVRERGGRARSMRLRFSVARSFFLHLRVELPRIPVRFMPDTDAVVGELTREKFVTLVRSAGVRNRAIYLTLFQGLMDQARFIQFNVKYGFALGEHIKRGVNTPFKVEFLKGRKENEQTFSSFIGWEAQEAWKVYFETIRGYPKQGEAAALDQWGKPLSKWGIYHCHMNLLRKLNFIKDGGKKLQNRYGLNLHEIRDVARSELERVRGVKYGPKDDDVFNTNSAEFWMGHTVDKYFYNKIWKMDPEYNLKQYRFAEKYLNIVSGETPGVSVERLIGSEAEMDKLVEALEERGFVVSPKELVGDAVQVIGRFGREQELTELLKYLPEVKDVKEVEAAVRERLQSFRKLPVRNGEYGPAARAFLEREKKRDLKKRKLEGVR